MDKLDFRVNNFDFIRLFAALQVVFGHAMRDFGPSVHPFVTGVLAAFPGVPIFFIISGFLISASLERNRSLPRYFWNRFLRIYPALWVCFGVTLATMFLAYDFAFDLGALAPWVIGHLSIGHFLTPELLRGYGNGVPNGSLWTIPVELQFYLVLPLLYWFFDRLGWNRLLLLASLLLMIGFNQYFWLNIADAESLGAKLITVTVAPYLFMFFLGVILQRNQAFIERFLKDRFLVLLIIYGLISIGSYLLGYRHGGTAFNPVSAIALSLLVISLAYSYQGKLGGLLRGHDISYGLYIYHMVWANLLLHASPLPPTINMGLMLVATIVSACLSWHYIERPALSLKNFSLKRRSANSAHKPTVSAP